MKVSVVVPTYQERDNIIPLVQQLAIVLEGLDYELIIVDDNSPDGTAELATSLTKTHPVRIIVRKGIRGLGSAILEGFRNAQGDIIGVIDADLQHPCEVMKKLVMAVENGADIAVASRFVDGGGIEHLSLARRIVSKGATLLARPITRVKDPMSGCFALVRHVFQDRNFAPQGYKLLLEILIKGDYQSIIEVPYVFKGRNAGKSKLGFMEYIRYLRLLSQLYVFKIAMGCHIRARHKIME